MKHFRLSLLIVLLTFCLAAQAQGQQDSSFATQPPTTHQTDSTTLDSLAKAQKPEKKEPEKAWKKAWPLYAIAAGTLTLFLLFNVRTN